MGLPNVGKSTLFNAMTAAHVPAENYPFCTKDHNTGMVAVSDKRLDDIAAVFKPERVVPTQVEFVDIAGLVEGAHKGEGLGNRFLGHIREVDAIAHIVRCFDAPDVVHNYATLDPIHDIEIINTELALADLETINKLHAKTASVAKSGDKKAQKVLHVAEKIKKSLEDGVTVRKLPLSAEELDLISESKLLTLKPMFYVFNINESDIRSPSECLKRAINFADGDSASYITICASTESDLAGLKEDERVEFLNDLGLKELGLTRIIHFAYKLLDLITFFTKDGPEVKAWTVRRGTNAPKAAGKIHSDFEKGFIRAEVYTYDELTKAGSETKLKEAGHIRIEGHDYVIKEGDIVHFRFNV